MLGGRLPTECGIADARRIVETGGRRKLGCTSTRWAERHPQGVYRIRKAAEPPTAAQQRMIGAEANRIAASNAATPRYGQCNRQALQLFKLPACNGNFLWEGEREGYLFSKKRYPSLSRAPCTVQGTKGPPANAGGPFLSPFGKSGYLLVHAALQNLNFLKQNAYNRKCRFS